MVTNIFFRWQESAAQESPRDELPRDAREMAALLSGDPDPEVRVAAAERCRELAPLAAAWRAEAVDRVRLAIASALAATLASTRDSAEARALLESAECTDAIRSEAAQLAQDPDRRALAIGAIASEDIAAELALHAERAETRIAAAERVHRPELLRRLAEAAREKDRGVARLAKQRIDALHERARRQAEADAIITRLEELASDSGPILTAVVELDRRWHALDLSDDAERSERFGAVRGTIQARFEREQDEPRRRAQFERRLRELVATLSRALAEAAPAESAGEAAASSPVEAPPLAAAEAVAPVATEPARPELSALRAELAALREESSRLGHSAGLAQIGEAERRIQRFEAQRQAQADAEALVAEAEALASAAQAEDRDLQARWHALDSAARSAALKRRFKAALAVIEQRRTEQSAAASKDAAARRHKLHGLLHDAEQALAAGQLQAARSAADAVKGLKAEAGQLPRPTTQRVSRLMQQLGELERWETFGQQEARARLCERAEALAAEPMEPGQAALEVRKLREEWKTLDKQHAGVPKALWLRFDAACEKAYAPAARHFAEAAARKKEARKRRGEFIAAAQEKAQTLPGETPDWRAVDHWLRDTDRAWRDGNLGSVDQGAWKKLDAQFSAALAPLRAALAAAGAEAKERRLKLIAEAEALSSRALEQEAPSRVKAIQARWQEEAKSLPLARRDEQQLWEKFRAACDAVFQARDARRKEQEERKHEGFRALEEACAQLESLSNAKQEDDQAIRRQLREQIEQWKARSRGAGPVPRKLEARFDSARTAVEKLLSEREQTKSSAVWQTLAQKERACEALDRLVRDRAGDAAQAASAQEQWQSLPGLPPALEKKLVARRDAALHALSDGAAADAYVARIERGAASRSQALLEMELALGLPTPAEQQAERLALQMKKLKDRFKGASTPPQTPAEQLVAWCAEPGVCSEQERQRSEVVFTRLAVTRVKV